MFAHCSNAFSQVAGLLKNCSFAHVTYFYCLQHKQDTAFLGNANELPPEREV
jgi:hypothetical protein